MNPTFRRSIDSKEAPEMYHSPFARSTFQSASIRIVTQ